MSNFLKLIKGDGERVCCLSVAQQSIGVAINQSLGVLHLSQLSYIYAAICVYSIIVVTPKLPSVIRSHKFSGHPEAVCAALMVKILELQLY